MEKKWKKWNEERGTYEDWKKKRGIERMEGKGGDTKNGRKMGESEKIDNKNEKRK